MARTDFRLFCASFTSLQCCNGRVIVLHFLLHFLHKGRLLSLNRLILVDELLYEVGISIRWRQSPRTKQLKKDNLQLLLQGGQLVIVRVVLIGRGFNLSLVQCSLVR
jgi:hypothetical protein